MRRKSTDAKTYTQVKMNAEANAEMSMSMKANGMVTSMEVRTNTEARTIQMTMWRRVVKKARVKAMLINEKKSTTTHRAAAPAAWIIDPCPHVEEGNIIDMDLRE